MKFIHKIGESLLKSSSVNTPKLLNRSLFPSRKSWATLIRSSSSIFSLCVDNNIKKFSRSQLIVVLNHVFSLLNCDADLPANIRLDEDVLKTSWRRLSSSSSKDAFMTSSRRLDEDKYILINLRVQKMSSRRLQDALLKTNILVLSIRLQDVFKTSSKRLAKTSRK